MNDMTVKQAAEREPDISLDFQKELLDDFRAAAPEVFTEDKFDWEHFPQLTGGTVENNSKRLSFNWVGPGLPPRAPSLRSEAKP